MCLRELHTAIDRSGVEVLVHGCRAVMATMKLNVALAGSAITVRIDDKQVATVTTKDHPAGGVAFGAVNVRESTADGSPFGPRCSPNW